MERINKTSDASMQDLVREVTDLAENIRKRDRRARLARPADEGPSTVPGDSLSEAVIKASLESVNPNGKVIGFYCKVG